MNNLSKTLTLSSAIGLAFTIIIGSGLLLLPGIVYHSLGSSSIYVWAINAIIVIPMLIIFSKLGTQYPSAGGIAGFVQEAFGRKIASGAEVILMGTFTLGIPAIALTGGFYLSNVINSNYSLAHIFAILIVLIAYFINIQGNKLTANIQKILSLALLSLLIIIPISAIIYSKSTNLVPITPLTEINYKAIFPFFGLVFFAFTGWEMLSFTIEEFKNPKRDYPLSIAISFIAIISLYFFIVFTFQLVTDKDNQLMLSSPFLILANIGFGKNGQYVVAILVSLIIIANVIGALWASSRLIFSSAREGLLPNSISKTNSNNIPKNALTLATIVFTIVIILSWSHIITIETLLNIAGKNFFVIYILSILSYIKITNQKIFGILTLILTISIAGTFGTFLMYPILLFLFGYIKSK